jgi:uncharacterized RDD family membrane protein YckC
MVSFSDEQLSIGTPENVTFGYEMAGIGSRFLAAIVDTALIVLLQFVVFGLLFSLAGGLATVESIAGWLVAVFTLLAFALFWGYYIFFEVAWNGRSPGKKWAALRVIRSDGSPITLTESIIRNLVRLVDFLPLYYALGVLTMFIDGRSRRLGDLAAGTLVVRDGGAVTLESLAEAPAHRLYGFGDQEAVDLPLDRLQKRDVRLAEELLRRYPELHNGDELARQVLQALYRRLEVPPPPVKSGEAHRLIAQIVAARTQAGSTSAAAGNSAGPRAKPAICRQKA